MVLLVVGNYQAVKFDRIPWSALTGVLWVHCRQDSTPDLKYQLKIQCREHGIPLDIQFAIPPSEPTEAVPTELLRGFGLRIDREVILYDERFTPFQAATPNQVTKACSYVLASTGGNNEGGH